MRTGWTLLGLIGILLAAFWLVVIAVASGFSYSLTLGIPAYLTIGLGVAYLTGLQGLVAIFLVCFVACLLAMAHEASERVLANKGEAS